MAPIRTCLVVTAWTTMLASCGTEATREVDRLSLADAPLMMEMATYRHGGIRLSPAPGVWISLEAGVTASRISGNIRLGPGHSLQMPMPSFTLLDPVTGKTEELAIESLSFESRCTLVTPRVDVPYSTRLAQNTCPTDGTDLDSVEGPVSMEVLDQRVDATTTTVFKRFSFAAGLRFHGADTDLGASSDQAQYARQYRFSTLPGQHFKAGESFILIPPRLILDGKEFSLPRLQLNRQTETSYQFRELM